MAKKLLFVFGIAVLVGLAAVGATYFRTRTDTDTSDEVHFHAGFAVIMNNALVDFSGPDFMHLSPCSEDEEEESLTAEEELLERAHLHDGIGDVVHVHRPSVLWQDLFANLDYSFADTVRAFRDDGTEVTNPLTEPIREYDRMLFIVGPADEAMGSLIDRVPTVERIKAVEQQGESC